MALAAYAKYMEYVVLPAGLVQHPTIEWLAGSPDGLIGEDGLVEVKCPYWQMKKGPHQEVPDHYYLQMQVQLQCTQREWCDYVCYCGLHGMSILHVTRDDALFEFLMPYLREMATCIVRRKGGFKALKNRVVKNRVQSSIAQHSTVVLKKGIPFF